MRSARSRPRSSSSARRCCIAPTLGNRRRTQLLLDLLACGLRKQTHELSWAAKVRRFLEANGGRPPAQRAHDDAHGAPSLYL
jgi:hypothetical protein